MSQRSLLRAPIHMFAGFFVLLHQVVQFDTATLNWSFGFLMGVYFLVVEFCRLYLSRNEENLRVIWPRFMEWYSHRWIPWWINHGGMRHNERTEFTASAYYWLGIAVVYFFLPLRFVIPAVLILAFGDPFARFVGVRWGASRVGLRGKSVAGCVAFAIAALVAIAVSFAIDFRFTQLMVYSPITFTSMFVAVLAAMVVEVYGGKYDNFFIPVVAGLVLVVMNG